MSVVEKGLVKWSCFNSTELYFRLLTVICTDRLEAILSQLICKRRDFAILLYPSRNSCPNFNAKAGSSPIKGYVTNVQHLLPLADILPRWSGTMHRHQTEYPAYPTIIEKQSTKHKQVFKKRQRCKYNKMISKLQNKLMVFEMHTFDFVAYTSR